MIFLKTTDLPWFLAKKGRVLPSSLRGEHVLLPLATALTIQGGDYSQSDESIVPIRVQLGAGDNFVFPPPPLPDFWDFVSFGSIHFSLAQSAVTSIALSYHVRIALQANFFFQTFSPNHWFWFPLSNEVQNTIGGWSFEILGRDGPILPIGVMYPIPQDWHPSGEFFRWGFFSPVNC